MTTKTITIDLADLQAERAHHAREIERIDSALAIVQTIAKRRRHIDTTIDKVRARAGKSGPKPSATAPHGAAAVSARRQKTAATLDRYDATEPRPAMGKAIGSLVRSGYLKSKGDGYVRTAKPYLVTATAPPGARAPKARRAAKGHKGRANAGVTKAHRAKMAQLLDRYDATEPRRIEMTRVSRLIAAGYLKSKGDGYIRTAKPYAVLPWKPNGSLQVAAE
jgi:hypothetical protein